MKPGARIAGRWIVEAELPGNEETRRFRVRDGDTLAEAIAPAGHALLRPGVRDAFVGLRLPDHPAALPTLATDVVDGLPVRVRPATHGSIEGVRLTAPEAVAAAGWLAPALLAAAGAGLGELGPEDLVRDAHGVLRLAPTGVPRVESVARVPRHRAPEGASTGEADLYGLGVTLYRAVAGEWPGRELRAPASAYGAGPEADAVLDGLLSSDPAARRAAVADLPCEPVHVAEAPARDLAPGGDRASATAVERLSAIGASTSPGAAPTVGAGAIKTTVPSPPPALPLGKDLPPYAVLVPLKGLPPDALRIVATRSVAAYEAVRLAAGRGATWAVDGAPTEAEAGRIRSRLEAAGVPGANLALTTTPKVVQLGALAVLAGVIAGVSALLAAPTIALGFAAVAAILVWLAAANLRAMFAVVETRNALQERERAALPASAPEARLRALRHRVAAARLPDIALSDLRGEVALAEERLDALRAHEAALTDAAADDLRARRDRVAAELAQVEASIARLDAALTRALTADLEEDAATARLSAVRAAAAAPVEGSASAPPSAPAARPDAVPEDEAPPPRPPPVTTRG